MLLILPSDPNLHQTEYFSYFSVERSLPVTVACVVILIIRRGGSKSDYLEQLSLRLLINEQIGGQWTARTLKFEGRKNLSVELSAEALIAVINTVP